MPIHDWTRVTAGTFHDFHLAWIAELRRTLNGGLLPAGYYALAEQVTGQAIPDVLTLQDVSGGAANQDNGNSGGSNGSAGGLAVAEAPPRVTVRETAPEPIVLAGRRRRIVIRHTTGDRIVALLEIVSPANKQGHGPFTDFVNKAVGALGSGYHLLIIDLFPPGTFDPRGIHDAIWSEFCGRYDPPPGKPLTLAAYVADGQASCYVEPTAVGAELVQMPLFLDPDHYVNVPLEATYLAAYEGVPQRWKRVIEA
jgi:hypothetical protein